MKRRTLDLIFAGGGLMVAVLLLALGFAMATQYSFSSDYVSGELAAQKISFAPAASLTDADTTWKAGSVCLVENAGQLMTTGSQAECYAKYYIAMHMANSAKAAGFDGATYATLGGIGTDLKAQVAAAKTKGDTAAATDLQKKVDAAASLRTTMQTGETLRGLLLTTYGFSVIGSVAGLASTILYGLALLLTLLSVAGLVHAFVTPKEKVVFGIPVGTKVPSPA